MSRAKTLWVATIFFGIMPLRGASDTQEHARTQLRNCIKNYHDRESILNAFQGWYGDCVEVDFNPVLPEGCQIIDMYGNNVCYGSGVVHTIMIRVQYQGFPFLLQYMALPNGEMNNLVIPLSPQDLPFQD